MKASLNDALQDLLHALAAEYGLGHDDMKLTLPASVYDKLLRECEFKFGPKPKTQSLIFHGVKARIQFIRDPEKIIS